MHALIIDDSRAMRSILRRIVTDLGFDTLEAGHGQEALDHLEAGRVPELCLIDWNMPVMDGYTFVTKVRAALPTTRIAYLGIKPSIQRWTLIAKVREANALIRELCASDDRVGFIDVDGPMLGWDEKPRKDLFVGDGLHMTDKGYALWTMLVRPFVEDTKE